MLKTLMKKSYQECFRTYFVNAKTGKARSKFGIIGMFTFFVLLMVFLAAIFFGLSYILGDPLFQMDLTWLYFALIGIIAISLGTFGSVFNTFASLYMAKDNELLLSMPIPPSKILLTRVSLVYGLSLLYSGIVWLPAVLYCCLFGTISIAAKIMGVVLFPFIALFVTVLTCALGWVVALVASRVKNKSFLVVLLSIVFLGGYYYLCFNMSDFAETVIANIGKLESGMKQWGSLFYVLGMAAAGDGKDMLLFCGITAALTAVCFYVLSRTFIRIVIKSSDSGKRSTKVKDEKSRSPKAALFSKEMKRFTGSPTYMLNCGLAIVLLPALGVMVLIKREIIENVLDVISTMLPDVPQFLPLVVVCVVCVVIAVNVISTPSVSLEGKNLWILQTLPVSGKEVLDAKLKLHVRLNGIPALFSAIVFCFCLKLEILISVLVLAFVWLFVWLTGAIGLILGVLRPNFTWSSEAMPIKQSLNVIISMLLGWILLVVLGGSYYFIWKWVSVQVHLVLCVAVLAAAGLAAKYWLDTKGARIFECR